MGIALLDDFLKPQPQKPAVSTSGFDGFVDEISVNYPDVPANIVKGLIQRESTWDPNATVHTGDKYGMARGLGQFIDETAKRYIPDWEDPSDSYRPQKNIEGIFRYLTDLKKQEGGNIDRALNRYHGGGTDILGTTSEQYVQQVKKLAGSPQVKAELDIDELFSSFITAPSEVPQPTEPEKIEGFKPVTKVPHPEIEPSAVTPKIETAPIEAPAFITEPAASTVVSDVPQVETADVDSQYYQVEQLFQTEKNPYKRAEALKPVPKEQRDKIIDKLPPNEQVNVREKFAELETASPFLGGLVKTVGAATKAAGDVLFPSFDPYENDANLEYIADTPEELKKIAAKYRGKDGKLKGSVNLMSGRLGSFLQQVKRFEEHPEKKEAVEETGKKIIAVGDVLDPYDYKEHKIEERIAKLKTQDNESAAAFERGDLGFVISQAIADAAISDDPEQAKKAIALKTKYETAVSSAPEKQKGMLKNLYLSTLEMLAPMVKTGVKMAVPVVGQVWGGYEWARQGMGDVYSALVEEGVSHETARRISPITGVAYAAVEQLQFGQLTNLAGKVTKQLTDKSIKNVVRTILKEKGKDFFKEVSEEGLQKFITDVGTEIGKRTEGLSEKEVGQFLLESGKNVIEEMRSAAGPMGVLTFLGISGKTAAESVSRIKKETTVETETTPEGVEVLPGGKERIEKTVERGKPQGRAVTQQIPVVPKEEQVVEEGKLGGADAGRVPRKPLEQLEKEAIERGDVEPLVEGDVVIEKPPEFVPKAKADEKPTAVKPTVEEAVVEEKLPSPEEIEAKEPSPKPKEVVEEKEEIGYPAKIVSKKFAGEKHEKPVFTEEYNKLEPQEKFKAITQEKKLIDKQIAKMKEENATVGFQPLNRLKTNLGKEQSKYSTSRAHGAGLKQKQIDRFAESGKPDTKLTKQISEDLDVVFEEFEGKSLTDLNNLLKGKYTEKQLNTAVEAIKKGNKDGKAAQDIRKEVGEYLQGGTNPAQIVDLATKEAGFSTSTEGFFEEKPTKKELGKKISKAEAELKTGDLFEGTLPKSTKAQTEIRAEKKKRAEKGGKVDETGLPIFEGGEGIVGGAEQKDVFEKPKKVKLPHEMTRREFVKQVFTTPAQAGRRGMQHQKLVENAIKSGKKVSPEVLKDYPSLVAKPVKAKKLEKPIAPVGKITKSERSTLSELKDMMGEDFGISKPPTKKQKLKVKELEKKRAAAKLKIKQPPKPKEKGIEGGVTEKEPLAKEKPSKKKKDPDIHFKKGEPVAFKGSIEEVKDVVSPELWKKIDISFATSIGKEGKRSLKSGEKGAIWVENGRLKVVVNPSLTSGQVARVLFHEVGGHAGATNVFKANPEIHKKISALYKGTRKSKLQDKVRRDYADELEKLSEEEQNELVFTEWVALNVEEHLANPRKKGVPYRVWKAVKKFLIDLGVKIENVDDVVNSMVKEMRTLRGVVAKKSESPLYSKAPPPFYSPTARKISELKQEKGVVPQIQSMIKKGALKKAEVEWMGLEEWLAENPKATKTEVQDFVKANEVTVEETEIGVGEKTRSREDVVESMVEEYSSVSERWDAINEEDSFEDLSQDERKKYVQEYIESDPRAFEDEINNRINQTGEHEQDYDGEDRTKYSQYTLPGGENYRELLFKMPERVPIFSEYAISKGFTQKQAKEFFNLGGTDEKLQKVYDEWSTKRNKYLAEGKYKSSHWDEPNVFAHARVNDRTTPEGEKVLFIEEIQSDWSREAREKGVKGDKWIIYNKQEAIENPDFVGTEKAAKKEADRIEGSYMTAKPSGVPDFPFRKNWQEFALKNLLKRAVSEGYDRISWVTGEQTADRYDLSKQISEIEWRPYDRGDGFLIAKDKNGKTVILREMEESDLPNTIGKEPAKRLLEQEVQEKDYLKFQKIEGENLKVGGAWANSLYDKQIPSFLKKYAKKWDAKVEETTVGADAEVANKELADYVDELRDKYEWNGHIAPLYGRKMNQAEKNKYNRLQDEADKAGVESLKQLSLPITPSMRESIIDEGQPMFSKELKEPGYIEKLRETGEAIPESLKDKVLRKLQDSQNRVKTIQELISDDIPDDLNTYLNIDVMSGKQENQLKEFHKKEIEPFEKDLAGFKGDLKKAEEFAYAMHAEERNETVKERRYSTSGEALSVMESEVLNKTEDLMESAEELSGKKADLQGRLKTEALTDAQKTRMNERIAAIDKSLDGVNNKVDKMNAQLKDMGVKVEEFKRVTESGSGMSKEEAKAIFEAAEAEGMTKEYTKLADQIVEINKQTSEIELEAGLISQETYDNRKKWKYYVPLMGLDEADPVRARGSQGFDIRGKEFQAALGRNSRASNILAHSITKRSQAVMRGETNKVAQTFKRFIDANPNPDMWEVDEVVTKPFLNKKTGEVEMRQVREFELTQAEQDRIFHVKVEGKPYEITIKDTMLGRAMKGLGTAKLGKGLQVMAAVNRYLSVIHTKYNPQFMATNFLRDFQAMGINIASDESFSLATKIGKGTPKAIWNILKADMGKTGTKYINYYNEFKEAGGKIGFMGIENVDQIQKRLLGEISLMKPGAKSQTIKAFKAVGKFIEVLNSSVENGVRLSTYIEMRERDVSKLKAAAIAKNVTVNFNKRGEWGANLNALYLFANANIQGNWRGVTAIMGDPKKKTGKNRGRKIAAAMILNGIALSEMARLIGGEDPDDGIDYYDKVPPWIKERHFVFMRPGLKTLDKDGFLNPIHYAKIPMPYFYNMFHAMGVAMDDVFHDPSKENILNNAGFVTSAMWNNFNPLGSAGSFLQTIMPTVLFRQAADLGLNRDYKDAPIAVEQHFGVKKSKSHTSKRKTSEQSKAVAQALNQVMGGTEYEPSWADVSPDVLDYFGEQITGGAGKTAGQVGNLGFEFVKAAVKRKKPDIALQEIPFVSRLLGEIPEYGDMGEYYDNMDKLEKARKQYDTYKKEKSPKRDAYYKKNKELLKLTEKKIFASTNKEGKYYEAKTTKVNRWNKKLKELRDKRDAAEKRGDTEKFEKYKSDIHKKIKQYNKKINEAK